MFSKILPTFLASLILASIGFANDTLPDSNPFPSSVHIGRAVGVWAEIDESAPSITVRFLFAADYQIKKRRYGETEWGDPVVASTGPEASSWTDTDVEPGIIYEYGVADLKADPTSLNPYIGFVTAGIRVDQAVDRGTIILVVADTAFNGNEARIDRLIADLVGDGWKVRTITAPSFYNDSWAYSGYGSGALHGHDAIRDIRRQIQSIYYEDPDSVKQLYLLGHVPFPMSGTRVPHPDGHAARGPIVADFFYGDMDGAWTDIETNPTSVGNGPSPRSLANVPGDGIFDQIQMPAPTKVGIGRVDAFNLGADPSEAERIGHYLDKAHRYRHSLPYGMAGSEVAAGNRAVFRYNPGGQPGAVATGIQFLAQFGPDKIDNFVQSLPGPVSPNTNSDVQYTIENGPYLYYGQNSAAPPGNSDFGSRAAHRFSMQSWWGDWWVDGNSRANLTLNTNQTLTWIYTGRFSAEFLNFPLGIGATFGEVLKLSANSEHDEYYTLIDPTTDRFSSSTEREFIHTFVGDPSLRLFPVAPARNLSATSAGSDVLLTWDAPVETAALEEYRVYRAKDWMGDFERIATGLTGTTFTDTAAPAGPNIYMVKAVHVTETGSGSYLNNAQGVFANLGLRIDTALLPPFPVGEDTTFALQVSDANGPVEWSLKSGQLPQGLELTTAGGLQGNPISQGHYTFELEAEDADGIPVSRRFNLLVDAAFSEVINIDMRAEGAGLFDKTQYRREVKIWGAPQYAPEGGMRFDGVDDAIQVATIGNSTYPDLTFLPAPRAGFAFVISFKADPDSAGGTLFARAKNFSTNWHENKTDYALHMDASGRVIAQNTSRRVTSATGYNDGQWHQAAFVSGKLYVDGIYIGQLDRADKNIDGDVLIGARWDDDEETSIADVFDGWLADFRGYNTGITDGEVEALFDKFSRRRTELNPQPPVISGLPDEILINNPGSRNRIERPFSITDSNGDPIKPLFIPSNYDGIISYEIARNANGYLLRAEWAEEFSGQLTLVIGADDGWPGAVAKHFINLTVVGAVDDFFHLPVAGGAFDVLANDLAPDGVGLAFNRIVSQPNVGYVEWTGDRFHFYPPSIWNQAVSFEYEIVLADTGGSSRALVTLIPENLPKTSDLSVPFSGGTMLLDVMAGAVDPEGETLSLVRVDQPQYGSTRIVGGQIEYTPPVGAFTLTDGFRYFVRNSSGFMSAGVVTIRPVVEGSGEPLIEYLFESGSGTTAVNTGTLGSLGDGQIIGGATWSTRSGSGTLHLNGTDAYINLGNPEALRFDPTVDSFSITMAFKPDSYSSFDTRNQYFFSKADLENTLVDAHVFAFAYAHPGFPANDFNNFLSILVGDSHSAGNFFQTVPQNFRIPSKWRLIDSNADVQNKDWRLYTLIYNADELTFSVFIDNWKVMQGATSGEAIPAIDNPWLIGAPYEYGEGAETLPDTLLKAAIDNFRMYDRALSPIEIKAMLEELDRQSSDLAPFLLPDENIPAPGTVLEVGKPYTFDLAYQDPDTPGERILVTAAVTLPGTGIVENYYTPSFTVTPAETGTLRIDYSFSQNDGLDLWTPDQSITYTVDESEVASTSFSVDTHAVLSPVRAGAAFSRSIQASGGTPPYIFRASNLPTGVLFDSATGELSGTIAAPGNYIIPILVRPSSYGQVIRYFVIPVLPADSDGDHLPDEWEMTRFGELVNDPSAKLEFALAGDLRPPGSAALDLWPTHGMNEGGGGPQLALVYNRRQELGELTLRLMRSENLEAWTEVPVQATVLVDDGEWQTVEVRLPMGPGSTDFYRLEVE